MSTTAPPTPEQRTEALANCLFLMITAPPSQHDKLPVLALAADFLAKQCTGQEIERAKAMAAFRAGVDKPSPDHN